ncbi:hypothetical protein BB561_002990 [Smittium simulii]|uniref:S1 motif domain-containing protein n=1 Tax=Smittium simulii TaxID=133385 RepID=A0A2T9YNH3_9FUNG|nr:hypothetical protein BB561_002990 [Smittium simulii]
MNNLKSKSSNKATPSNTPQKNNKRIFDNAADSSATKPSAIQNKEVDFPRGGGIGVTPLEFKKISQKANKDFFAENNSSKAKKRKTASTGKNQKLSSQDLATNLIEDKAEKLYKELAPLSFKRIFKDSKVLGVVTKIADLGLTVSLSNHLTAHVPITQISKEFTQILENFTQDQDKGLSVDLENEIDLNQLFHLGQFVKASVTITTEKAVKSPYKKNNSSSSSKIEKKIELTLEPEQVNKGLDIIDICESMVLSASVISVEDHGYRLNIGIDDVQGFLSFDNSDPYLHNFESPSNSSQSETNSTNKLKVGQVILVSVLPLEKSSSTTRVIHFTLDPNIMAKSHINNTLQSIYSAQPGSIIDGLVIHLGEKGAVMQFMGFYECTATISSLTDKYCLSSDKVLSKIKLGDKIKARIIFTYLSTTNKVIMVSTAQHIFKLSVPKWNLKSNSIKNSNSSDTNFDNWWPHKFGDVLNAKVTRSSTKSGVYLEAPLEKSKTVSAYANLGNITNSDDQSNVSKAISSFLPASEATVRVVGYSPMENCVLVSLKKSVVDEEYFKLDDVVLGKKIKGTVNKILENGIIVSLSKYVSSFVSAENLSDIKLSKIEKKFQEGDKVTARVLTINKSQKKVYLTLRKSLVESTLPIVTSYDSAKVGEITLGVVKKVIPESGAIVSFYQNFCGFIPIGEINGNFITDINSFLRVGQFIKVKVIKKDEPTSRILLSCKLDAKLQEDTTSSKPSTESIKVGSVFEDSIVDFINEAYIGVKLQPSNDLATLSVNHLSDHISNIVDNIQNIIVKGKPLGLPVTVLEIKSTGIVVSAKPLLVRAARQNRIVSSIDSCKVGNIEAGFISQITKFGVFVKFFGGYSGLASINSISDHYVSSAELEFQDGQTVLAKIVAIDTQTNKVSLSLKPSLVEFDQATANYKDWDVEPNQIFVSQLFNTEKKIYESVGNSEILKLSNDYDKLLGCLIQVKIDQVHSYGWMATPVMTDKNDFLQGASGFICNEQIIEFLKDQNSDHKSYVGKTLTAKIIDADFKKKMLDLSLKPSHTDKSKNSPKVIKKNLQKIQELSTKKLLVEVVIELVKEDHLVLSVPSCNNALVYSSSKNLNLRAKPFVRYKIGQRLKGKIVLEQSDDRNICLISYNSKSDSMDSVKRIAKNPVDPSINYFEDYQPGKLTKAKVVSILPNKLTAKLILAENIKANLMITEFEHSKIKDKDLFSSNGIIPGAVIDVTVIGVHVPNDTEYLPITKKINPSKVSLDVFLTNNSNSKQRSLQLSDIKPESKLTGFIYSVENTPFGGIWIAFNRSLKAKIPTNKITNDYGVISNLEKHFVIGSSVEVEITKIDIKKEKFNCVFTDNELLERKVPTLPKTIKEIKVGDCLAGVFTKFSETNGINVTINMLENKYSSEAFGRISLVNISDNYADIKKFVKDKVSKENFLKVKVIGIDNANKKIELSTRDSDFNNKNVAIIDPKISTLDELQVGSTLNGFIKSVSKNGIFVIIGSNNLTGRVKLNEISDEFIKNPEDTYEIGTLVKVSVLKLNQKQNQIELSMRTPKPISKLSVGDIVKGNVTKTNKSGIFIMVYDTFKQKKVVSLCPIDEIADTNELKAVDLLSHYSSGDKVLAKILSIDDKSRIIVSLKASNFTQDNTQITQDESLINDIDSTKQKDTDIIEDESDISDDDNSDSSDDESDNDIETAADINPLDIDDEFSWSNITESDKMDIDATDNIFNDEEMIDTIEDITAEMDSKAPATVEDFERLLVASPDKSYLWISYMAFYCDMGEIDMARKVCDRGIEKISYKLEQEKMNLYIARMNLEYKFGTQDELDQFVLKALQYNNPKHIHLQLVRIYSSNDNLDMATQTFQTVSKKFKSSCKVWVQYFEFSLKNDINSNDLMKRSLICLPKRKHIKAITKFAQLEFKYNHQERARTIFENLLSNYPSRSDLWNVYLDLEVKNLTKFNLDTEADILLVRNLFTRIISLKFNPRNKKLFFKKWLEFEKRFGSEDNIQNVKDCALEYVQSNQ